MNNGETKQTGPKRDKYWKELTADEKIQRMRVVIKGQTSEIKNLNEMIDFLMDHSHKDDKVVRIQGMRRGYACPPENSRKQNEEVYF